MLTKHSLPHKQSLTFFDSHYNLEEDVQTVYEKNQIVIGWPEKEERIFAKLSRPNTAAIVGIALGDEGKGRLVDNKIETLLKNKKIKHVVVIRYQGGSNAGHTVEKKGQKLALHLIPSFVFHEQGLGIMDQGMVVHPEDLQTEVSYVEEMVGSLQDRLFLSEDAVLCTDLERAEEVHNRALTDHAKGGTGRGIGPSYAHHYDKSGLRMYDLLNPSWEEILSKRYEQYDKLFSGFGESLSSTNVPDFATTVKSGKATTRKLGDKRTFLKRLEIARFWLLKREIVTNTYLLHRKFFKRAEVAILFEGAQAAGLDSWTGTRPDVTESNTTAHGVRDGTGFWQLHDITERIGILKMPYTSSVGARRMPTHIDLPKKLSDLSSDATPEQKWAAFIRDEAQEYGTTTGRPRDINLLDLPFIGYNCRIAGIESIIGTHLDICQEKDQIKICTHYTNKRGDPVPYQPGLRHLQEVIPQYVVVPGWNGKACQKAKAFDDLPIHAQKFLAFLQLRLGFPITGVTTGPSRSNFLSF